jgi:quercetin dioxygenase-like cupin family protein
MSTDEPIALGPGEGGAVKADRPELTLLEITFDPGRGVDPHFHKVQTDSFYVLEGEVEFHLGEQVFTATPGSYVLAPPNVVHFFRNVSDKPVRMLNLHTPGGFAEYRRQLAELRRQGIEPDREFFEGHDVFDV